MSSTIDPPIEKTPFAGGMSLSLPLRDDEPLGFVHLDWSICRPVRDRLGVLRQTLDVPDHAADEGWLRRAPDEPFAMFPSDVSRPSDTGTVHGIDIEAATYETESSRACRWEISHSWNRLRGCMLLAPAPMRVSPRFADFLFRLNGDVRYVRVGIDDGHLAVQAVIPGDDQRWQAVAARALEVVARTLLPQVSWWQEAPELVDDLLRSAGW